MYFKATVEMNTMDAYGGQPNKKIIVKTQNKYDYSVQEYRSNGILCQYVCLPMALGI